MTNKFNISFLIISNDSLGKIDFKNKKKILQLINITRELFCMRVGLCYFSILGNLDKPMKKT